MHNTTGSVVPFSLSTLLKDLGTISSITPNNPATEATYMAAALAKTLGDTVGNAIQTTQQNFGVVNLLNAQTGAANAGITTDPSLQAAISGGVTYTPPQTSTQTVADSIATLVPNKDIVAFASQLPVGYQAWDSLVGQYIVNVQGGNVTASPTAFIGTPTYTPQGTVVYSQGGSGGAGSQSINGLPVINIAGSSDNTSAQTNIGAFTSSVDPKNMTSLQILEDLAALLGGGAAGYTIGALTSKKKTVKHHTKRSKHVNRHRKSTH